MTDKFKYWDIETLIKVFMGDFDYNYYQQTKNDPNKISDYRDGEINISSY